MEMVWGAVAVLSGLFAVFIFIEKGFTEDNYYLLAVPGMAFVLFLLRRVVRKRMEKYENAS